VANRRLVTTGDAARALGVSSTTLQRWARAGAVTPVYRTRGGHFRWDLEALWREVRAESPASSVERPSPRGDDAQIQDIRSVDVLDGGEADETVEFGFEGRNYEIDLSEKNVDKLREAFAPFIQAARRAGR
jgi:excisionase family DNA binding protein